MQNRIRNVTYLRNLRKLQQLIISKNQVVSISPLSELDSLQSLEMSDNRIWDDEELLLLSREMQLKRLLCSKNGFRNPALSISKRGIVIKQIVCDKVELPVEFRADLKAFLEKSKVHRDDILKTTSELSRKVREKK